MMDTCINCMFYSMWEGVCMCPYSEHLFNKVYADETCGYFKRDKEEI